MDIWQRRVERAEVLARRFPFSAELMYFYRDILRFQTTMQRQNVTPLRGLPGALGEFFDRVLEPPPQPHDCGHAARSIHTDEEFPHIRIEACETCRAYCKVVDLTQDPDAIFEVDDLASVPLDIWAAENGFRRLTPNLFGF